MEYSEIFKNEEKVIRKRVDVMFGLLYFAKYSVLYDSGLKELVVSLKNWDVFHIEPVVEGNTILFKEVGNDESMKWSINGDLVYHPFQSVSQYAQECKIVGILYDE